MDYRARCLKWITALAAPLLIQGLNFGIQRYTGGDYCATLHCSTDSEESGKMLSVISLTIFDLSAGQHRSKFASMKLGEPLYVNNSKSNRISSKAYMSDVFGSITLRFAEDKFCLHGKFECWLEYRDGRDQVESVSKRVDAQTDSRNPPIHLPKKTVDDRKAEQELEKLHRNAHFGIPPNFFTATISDNHDAEQELNKLNPNAHFGIPPIFFPTMISDNENVEQELQQKYESLQKTCAALSAALHKRISELESENRYLASHIHQGNDKTEHPHTQSVVETEQKSELEKTCPRHHKPGADRQKLLLFGCIPVLCDTVTDGGGWLIIQRRVKGDVDFYRGWDDYKNGFGTIDSDFWIGNNQINYLTSQGYTELRIDIKLSGTSYYAHHTYFKVDNEQNDFALTTHGHSGNLSELLPVDAKGLKFSTFDRDNDQDFFNCASIYRSAWWFNTCAHDLGLCPAGSNNNWLVNSCPLTSLNGAFSAQKTSNFPDFWGNKNNILSFSEMKIRRK